MTLNEFFVKYEGKGLDVDSFPKNNPYQCMDVYRAYVKEVLGAKQSPSVAGAKDVWNTYLTEVFTKVTNKPDNAPKPGDIVIWGTDLGEYGHIAVCSQADTNSFTCFGQNFPIGSTCHFQKHTYFGVLGWLHPKGVPVPVPINPDQVKVDLGEPFGEMEVQAIRSRLNDLSRAVTEAQAVSKEIEVQYQMERTAKEQVMKEDRDRLDTFWDKLSPIGKEKNWANVLGEIEGLLKGKDNQEAKDPAIGLIQLLINIFRKRGE